MSTSEPRPPAIGEIIGQRRAAKGLSLQDLSNLSGVSKGMISQIENGQVNPTLAIMWKLAAGLGMRLQDLFEGDSPAPTNEPLVFLTEENCPTLASTKNGYRIQILSSVDMVERVELYLVHLDPTGVMESQAHAAGTVEILTVIKGEVEVSTGTNPGKAVKALESVRYAADVPHTIRARGKKETLAYLAVKFAAIVNP